MISYKYNIYHSKKTKYLVKILRECCFVWNHALALQRRYYKLFGKYISVDKMKKHFTKRIKRNLLHPQTTQEILERLDESYNRFFKKLAKRPPKFKSPEKFNSFVFKQGGFTLNGNCLTINKGKKRFRFSYSRVYEGNVKQIRIVRETCSRFSLIIVTDHNPSNSYRKTHDGASIGLDFGLKTYLTKSDGSKIDSPLFLKQYQNKIRKLNKRLSNAKKGSNNRRRRLFELQQAYRKINNLRSDFQSSHFCFNPSCSLLYITLAVLHNGRIGAHGSKSNSPKASIISLGVYHSSVLFLDFSNDVFIYLCFIS